jgi:CubicO group peptidase (beta-lactamase class C family)
MRLVPVRVAYDPLHPRRIGWLALFVAALLASSSAVLACSNEGTARQPTSSVGDLVSDRDECRTQASIRTTVEPLFEATRIPGMSLVLVKEHRVLWEDAFGWADVGAGIKMSTRTPIEIASIGKAVTATAIMQLWERGLFGLDDDVGNFLPYSVRNPNFPDTPITFRMLLGHASSVQDNWSVMPYFFGEDSPVSIADYVESYLDPAGSLYDPSANFYAWAPGTQVAYCNIGYALLGALVEAISNTSFEKYTEEHVFGPLRMRATWRLAGLGERGMRPAALPYQYDPSTDSLSTLGLHTFPDVPDGGLFTDAASLSHLLLASMNGGEFQGARILSPRTVKLMQTVAYPEFGSIEGLGFEIIEEQDGSLYIGHWGGDLGIRTYMFYRPSDRVGVIALGNGDIVLYSDASATAFAEIIDYLFSVPAGDEGGHP